MQLCSMIQVFHRIADLQAARAAAKPASVGFVPTMGALHAGHISLAQRALAENELTIVSIFVNPTQFGPNEDYNRYPRTLAADCALLESLGREIWVFAPNAEEMYPVAPAEMQIGYTVKELDKKLCGKSRPGHFNGVLQVVSILFHIVQPTRAYFGEKDYQQCALIRRMTIEQHFPLTIVPCDIVREPDGLAMSSRNVYLSAEERAQALGLYKTLCLLRENRVVLDTPEHVKTWAQQSLAAYPLIQLDYFEVLESADLSEIAELDMAQAPRMFVAAFLGKTRLIDNMPL